jgi:hypothetical protein
VARTTPVHAAACSKGTYLAAHYARIKGISTWACGDLVDELVLKPIQQPTQGGMLVVEVRFMALSAGAGLHSCGAHGQVEPDRGVEAQPRPDHLDRLAGADPHLERAQDTDPNLHGRAKGRPRRPDRAHPGRHRRHHGNVLLLARVAALL